MNDRKPGILREVSFNDCIDAARRLLPKGPSDWVIRYSPAGRSWTALAGPDRHRVEAVATVDRDAWWWKPGWETSTEDNVLSRLLNAAIVMRILFSGEAREIPILKPAPLPAGSGEEGGENEAR